MSLNSCKDERKQEGHNLRNKYKIKTPHPRIFLADENESINSKSYYDDLSYSNGLIKQSFTTKDNSYIGDEKNFQEYYSYVKNPKTQNFTYKKISDNFVNFQLLKKNKISSRDENKNLVNVSPNNEFSFVLSEDADVSFNGSQMFQSEVIHDNLTIENKNDEIKKTKLVHKLRGNKHPTDFHKLNPIKRKCKILIWIYNLLRKYIYK
jgi:hypothetical protein